jgi:ribosomal protein S6--L-glutamate ligase
MKADSKLGNKIIIGRSEWSKIPDLNIPAIRAKIDTGAKTSAIHAFNIKTSIVEGLEFVNFDVHPIQKNDSISVNCSAQIIDQRSVLSSNGIKENRYVIETPIILGGHTWKIELTLSSRDQMKFRLLLGREALNNRVLIDPSKTYRLGTIEDAPSLYT